MSIQDIVDRMESYQRVKETEMRLEISLKHFLTRDIAQYISLVFNGEDSVELKELWDFFPDLFKEEKETYIKNQLQVYKAQMMDYSYRHNHARGGGKTRTEED